MCLTSAVKQPGVCICTYVPPEQLARKCQRLAQPGRRRRSRELAHHCRFSFSVGTTCSCFIERDLHMSQRSWGGSGLKQVTELWKGQDWQSTMFSSQTDTHVQWSTGSVGRYSWWDTSVSDGARAEAALTLSSQTHHAVEEEKTNPGVVSTCWSGRGW